MRDYYKQLCANKMDNLEEMDEFSEKHNLQRLNQEEIENISIPITSTEIETVIKNLPTKKKPRTRWLQRWILWNIYRRANTYPSQTLPKYSRRGNTPKLLLQGHHHPDTKIRQRWHKERKLQANITDEHSPTHQKMRWQKNMLQTNEQGENLQDQISEEEIGNLPEKEFRVMIVKMIQNLRNRM